MRAASVAEQIDQMDRLKARGMARFFVLMGFLSLSMTLFMVGFVGGQIARPAPGLLDWLVETLLLSGVAMLTVVSWIGAIKFAKDSREGQT